MQDSERHSFIKFSFVLPAWKGQYLKEAIESILAQDCHDFELIVVDDCSPDNLEAIVQGFHDSRISYYRNEKNMGGKDLVEQWNHSLSYASGEYVVLATDDDLYEPAFLSSFMPLIDKHPDVELFRARILQVDADNHIMDIDTCYKEYLSKDEFVYHMLHGMRGGIPQYIFKREALLEKGGFVNFPKAWASDDATAIMMAEHGVVTSQEHLVRFRWSNINISSDKTVIKDKIGARLLFYKWLKRNLTPIKPTSEKSLFLYSKIDQFIPTYNKLSLIAHLNNVSCVDKIRSLITILSYKDISIKDKLSIVYRAYL